MQTDREARGAGRLFARLRVAVSGFALGGFRSELLGDPERFDEEGKTDCDWLAGQALRGPR